MHKWCIYMKRTFKSNNKLNRSSKKMYETKLKRQQKQDHHERTNEKSTHTNRERNEKSTSVLIVNYFGDWTMLYRMRNRNWKQPEFIYIFLCCCTFLTIGVFFFCCCLNSIRFVCVCVCIWEWVYLTLFYGENFRMQLMKLCTNAIHVWT